MPVSVCVLRKVVGAVSSSPRSYLTMIDCNIPAAFAYLFFFLVPPTAHHLFLPLLPLSLLPISPRPLTRW